MPPAAAFGLVGFRLNAECLCHGFNNVLIGPLSYNETNGGSLHYSYQLPFAPQTYNGVLVDSMLVAGVPVTHIIATPAQTFYPNSKMFPVTPGAEFTYTIPASTIGGNGWFGHVFIGWFDKDRHPIPNLPGITVVPSAGRTLTSSTITDKRGAFLLKAFPRAREGSLPTILEYAGSDNYRATIWTRQQ